MPQPKSSDEQTVAATGTIWPESPIGRVAAPLRDRVLEAIRQAILDRRLRPGQRLIERELMEQLGVSRPTIREVVARLASEGLVTEIPQRGAIVSVLTPDEAADIYEMRMALEALAVQRFIERATAEQVAELRAAFEDLTKLAETAETLDQLKAKDTFYKALFTGAGSPPLTQMLTTLQGRVALLRSTSMSTPGRTRDMLAEVQAIVEAIEARDTARAKTATATHIRNAAQTALSQISAQEETEIATRPRRRSRSTR